jgi:hypothetical protein
MEQRDISLERMRTNVMVMTFAALATVTGLALPWFRFETPLPLDLEPGARAAFERDVAPAGPLSVFTRFSLSVDGLVGRVVLVLFLTEEGRESPVIHGGEELPALRDRQLF